MRVNRVLGTVGYGLGQAFRPSREGSTGLQAVGETLRQVFRCEGVTHIRQPGAYSCSGHVRKTRHHPGRDTATRSAWEWKSAARAEWDAG